jgi:TM2 domain-containing membrane protein YozV
LSFILPGLGQIYNGDIGKGIIMIIISVIMWALIWLLIPGIVILVLWIYGIYDAYKTAERINANAARGYQQPYRPY